MGADTNPTDRATRQFCCVCLTTVSTYRTLVYRDFDGAERRFHFCLQNPNCGAQFQYEATKSNVKEG